MGNIRNETADKSVKATESSELPRQCIQLYRDLKSLFKKTIRNNWVNVLRKLSEIQRTPNSSILPLTKREEKRVFRRLRIGHTQAIHEHLIEYGKQLPYYANCQNTILTVKTFT